MTDNSSPKTGDLHIRVDDELMAAIDAMGATEMRNRSTMARVLLAEAVAARRAKSNESTTTSQGDQS